MATHRTVERRVFPLAAVLFVFGALGLLGKWFAVRAEPQRPKEARPAAKARVPWTTSRVVGSPDPPAPFKVVRAFPNLKFEHPLLMARAPGSSRLYIGEQAGVLYSFEDRPDAKADLFFDLRKELQTLQLLPQAKGVEAVYGLTFDPAFEQNRFCYVCYTLASKQANSTNLPEGSRVSRFVVTRSEPPRIDPASEEIILTFLQGGHNGGDLHFGPDGMLYISTGDAASPNPPDPLNTGQDISDLLSSILRIDVHHRDPGKNYAVPRDNPFVALKGARPEVWAYGFRNPWRMGFDRQTGELFVGDVGWELWEMVHRVEKGGNYGWAAMEGPQPIKPERVGPTPIIPPLIQLPHTVACSVTGGRVYRGKKFPELQGAYIFGDWETRRLWAARFEGDRTKEMPEIARPLVRIVAFGEDQNNELYFLDYDGGTVHTIERNDAGGRNTAFPTRLSETGLFTSVKDGVPAPGVLPFAINSRQWQDGASAEHWFAFPGLSGATLYTPGKPIPGNVDWHLFRMHFPKDAVLVRTLSLAGRRVETQLLHFDGVDWRPYAFAWRDDQTDADLVPAEGAEKEVPDGKGKRLWQFHSRTQCLTCHSSWSEYALGFQPEQLNRAGPDGRNQLVAFCEAEIIRRAAADGTPQPAFEPDSVAREPRLVNPADSGAPLEARARSYLHANCAHCHMEGGGGAVELHLPFSLTLAETKAIGVRPTRGDFGLPDAALIKPGDPWSSVIYFRMAKFARDRMPHLGSDEPDEAALRIVEAWIESLSPAHASMAPQLAGKSPEQWLENAKTALFVARRLARGQCTAAERAQILAAAAKLPPSPIRDLFEGYFPASDRGAPRLGSRPRPKAILSLKGDVTRGEKLFWSESINCGRCHKIGERGTVLGPDLTAIGKQRTREDLLESILEPSRRIEPKFAAHVAHTSDGKLITGLLIKRDDKQVILRDAQNKEIVLSAKNVEELYPSRTSLMPDGQLAGLTAQDAADLLEYLATRR